jgi:hypothetical protein
MLDPDPCPVSDSMIPDPQHCCMGDFNRYIPQIPRSTKESIPKLGTERNNSTKICFTKQPKMICPYLKSGLFWNYFLPRNALKQNSESLLLFLFHGTEFWAFFSSAELFGKEEFSVPQNNRNSVGTNQFVSSIPSFAELSFCLKFPAKK